MEEQPFESMYLLLRMVICQLVQQTLRKKNVPKVSQIQIDGCFSLFTLRFVYFFIQTKKKLPKQCVYVYINTQYIIYIYINPHPHQIHILPKHPLTTHTWLFFGDRAPLCGTFTPFASKSRQIWVTCALKPGWGGVVLVKIEMGDIFVGCRYRKLLWKYCV